MTIEQRIDEAEREAANAWRIKESPPALKPGERADEAQLRVVLRTDDQELIDD